MAVLLVIGRHGAGPQFWGRVGWVGVDLFFVLSGFLISGLLFTEYKKTGGIDWGRFFIRRGFKIYPSFYAMILATLVWQAAEHRQTVWRQYLPEIFFYQCYAADRLWVHTWSLAVEEHFYIFLPVVLLLMLRFQRGKNAGNPFRMVPVVAFVLAVSCLVQRLYLAEVSPASQTWALWIQCPTHLRIDSLFFGVFLGYLHHFHAAALKQNLARRWLRVILFLASAILVSTCAFFDVNSLFMLSFGLTALYLGFGGILMLTLYGEPWNSSALVSWLGKFRAGDLLAYIGMYSYSIYLWHVMIAQHLHWPLRLLWPSIGETAFFWAYVVASLAGGIVLSRLIEYPALHVRDRLFPSRGGKSMGFSQRATAAPSGPAVVFAPEAPEVQTK